MTLSPTMLSATSPTCLPGLRAALDACGSQKTRRRAEQGLDEEEEGEEEVSPPRGTETLLSSLAAWPERSFASKARAPSLVQV